ncbi:hypothetical protein BKA66DRAFT_511905 [Pyrenochaeta sp. MPI-SDFR-AT-0127]|nr:hypothetical protein BKA66DRAFT_511905 [Pyrenochaeta sp. MPI-SDFR-AT-0127]
MSLTYDQLVQLHVKAKQLLERKLACIPARVFPSGRRPTIADIYERPEALINSTIHQNLQLLFVFENYNKFAMAGFRARKKEQELMVGMAIYYWNMDQQHSLSTHHKEVRFNVLLAHIMLETPNARANMDDELHRFLDTFIRAWLESAVRLDHSECLHKDYWIAKCWKPGKYDLIRWTSHPRQRMSAAVKALESAIPPQPFNVEEFWSKASAQPAYAYEEHGRAWAMQYVIYKEKQAKAIDRYERGLDAQESLKSGDFTSGFGQLGMQDDSVPAYLSEELFRQPLVQALLTDVTEGMGVQNVETNVPWMSPSEAIDLVEGKIVGFGMDELTDRIKVEERRIVGGFNRL